MRPRITLTNAVGLTRVTSNRRVNQSSRIFLLTRPGFIEVDAAARIKAPSAAPNKLRNTLPPLASNELLCSLPTYASQHEPSYVSPEVVEDPNEIAVQVRSRELMQFPWF